MHVLQRTFCVILISLSVLTRVLAILLKEPMNTTVNDEFRDPTFTDNLLRGLDRAQVISGLSSTMPLIEVRNTSPLGSRGSTSLNEFRTISIDLIIEEGPLAPYNSQCTTLFGSARRWGSWATSLVDFRAVDVATIRRTFEWDQIVMDEEEAHAILRTAGFKGPWVSIYLCKLAAIDSLFYVFQQARGVGNPQTIYQFVGVEDGRVRLFHGAVQHPCSVVGSDNERNISSETGKPNTPAGITKRLDKYDLSKGL